MSQRGRVGAGRARRTRARRSTATAVSTARSRVTPVAHSSSVSSTCGSARRRPAAPGCAGPRLRPPAPPPPKKASMMSPSPKRAERVATRRAARRRCPAGRRRGRRCAASPGRTAPRRRALTSVNRSCAAGSGLTSGCSSRASLRYARLISSGRRRGRRRGSRSSPVPPLRSPWSFSASSCPSASRQDLTYVPGDGMHRRDRARIVHPGRPDHAHPAQHGARCRSRSRRPTWRASPRPRSPRRSAPSRCPGPARRPAA